jgi:hypothetical protein
MDVDGHALVGVSVEVTPTVKPGTVVVVVENVDDETQSLRAACFALSALSLKRWSAVTRSRFAFEPMAAVEYVAKYADTTKPISTIANSTSTSVSPLCSRLMRCTSLSRPVRRGLRPTGLEGDN